MKKRVIFFRTLGIILYLGLLSMLTIPLLLWFPVGLFISNLVFAMPTPEYLNWCLLSGWVFAYGACLALSPGALIRLFTSTRPLLREAVEIMILVIIPLSVSCIRAQYLQLAKSLPDAQHYILYGAMFFMFAIAVNVAVIGMVCKHSIRCLKYIWAAP